MAHVWASELWAPVLQGLRAGKLQLTRTSSNRALEDVSCNLCGSSEITIVEPASDAPAQPSAELADVFRSSSTRRLHHQLVACSSCGLQYVSPRPPAHVVLEGYSSGADELFVSQVRGRELTFARSLDLIEHVWNQRPGRLLDVGTGGGSFPFVASKRGWQAEGCEPNHWLCEWGFKNYGLRIRPGTVFDQYCPAGAYDVVTLWDVLEHTPDPKKEIREVYRLLGEGGLIVVNFPDIGSWIARLLGRSWVFLLDVHLYYFTRATMSRLLEDAGFDVVFTRPHFQRLGLGYLLYRAAVYIGSPARLAARVARRIGIAERQVPYWMGQTLVIARKRPTT